MSGGGGYMSGGMCLGVCVRGKVSRGVYNYVQGKCPGVHVRFFWSCHRVGSY